MPYQTQTNKQTNKTMNTSKASIELVNGETGLVYTSGWVSGPEGEYTTIQFYDVFTEKVVGDRFKIFRTDVIKFTWVS